MESKSLMKLFGMDKPIDFIDEEDLTESSMKDLLARIPVKRTEKKKKKKKLSFPGKKRIIREEWYFHRKIVIPMLEEMGHHVKMVAPLPDGLSLHPIIDIFSTFRKKNYFTEVKVRANMNSLQKAIGQLVLQRIVQEWDNKARPENIYQIAFPASYKDEKIFSPRLYQLLREKAQIRIVFF